MYLFLEYENIFSTMAKRKKFKKKEGDALI
jgi:hypothetical protein